MAKSYWFFIAYAMFLNAEEEIWGGISSFMSNSIFRSLRWNFSCFRIDERTKLESISI
jgi:hypothetical protein